MPRFLPNPPKPLSEHVRRHSVSLPPAVDDALTAAMSELGTTRSWIVEMALRAYPDVRRQMEEEAS